ncbi:putative conjugal transfer protein [Escherichia coli M056]|nr:conjugal transfer protein [Escherichia coli]OSK15979.1 putative conjugal transfer protein [Escherichia coli M056]
MKRMLMLTVIFSLLAGCANRGKNLPPVSGTPEPINTQEVMNNVQP